MLNSRIKIILAIVAMLLLIPFVAMQFTEEVQWNMADFVIMGTLLSVTGITCDLAWQKISGKYTRIFVCILVLLAFLLIWAELAVGVFGSPWAGS